MVKPFGWDIKMCERMCESFIFNRLSCAVLVQSATDAAKYANKNVKNFFCAKYGVFIKKQQ